MWRNLIWVATPKSLRPNMGAWLHAVQSIYTQVGIKMLLYEPHAGWIKNADVGQACVQLHAALRPSVRQWWRCAPLPRGSGGSSRWHSNKWHCTHCTALPCTTLHYTALHCTTLHYAAQHCTTLHYTALHCTTLHYTALQTGSGTYSSLKVQLILLQTV